MILWKKKPKQNLWHLPAKDPQPSNDKMRKMRIQEAKKYQMNILHVIPKNNWKQLLKSSAEQTAIEF